MSRDSAALAKVSRPGWEWTDQRRCALDLLASGGRTYAQIADELGVSRIALWEWRRTEEFAKALDELNAILEEETRLYAVARRHDLLEGLTERRERLLRVVTEREEYHEEHQTGHPGATTGYMVKTIKNIGSGPTAYPVDEWAVDKALVSSLNEVEKFGATLAGVLTPDGGTDLDLTVQGPAVVIRVRDQQPMPYTPSREGMDAPGRYEEVDGVWRDVETGEPFTPLPPAIASTTPRPLPPAFEKAAEELLELYLTGAVDNATFDARLAELKARFNQ